ncbi:MAG TPA: NTP transferase domain-containing protein, partial [Woeseiaceae bacterium]|nr:NTP transferase domain-containing protein [Woeseiaceae bacterium]
MLSIVILAAGKGTRMNSGLPKVLQPLSGKPLLEHVVRTARMLNPEEIIIVHGYAGDTVKANVTEEDIKWVHQKEQLGTGHAVMQATDIISNDNNVLVLYGDVPLVSANTLQLLISEHQKGEINLLTTTLPSAEGYGRILRCNENVQAIVEDAEANETEKQINEINTGIMYCKAEQLKSWLSRLENNNTKNEYYLTDVIDMATKEGI